MMYDKYRIKPFYFYLNTKLKGLFEMVKSKYIDNTIFNREKLLFICLEGNHLSLYTERYFYNGKRKKTVCNSSVSESFQTSIRKA